MTTPDMTQLKNAAREFFRENRSRAEHFDVVCEAIDLVREAARLEIPKKWQGGQSL